MTDLEEKILNASQKKPMIWRRYTDDIWKNVLINLIVFIRQQSLLLSTQRKQLIFLGVNIRLVGGAHDRFVC